MATPPTIQQERYFNVPTHSSTLDVTPRHTAASLPLRSLLLPRPPAAAAAAAAAADGSGGGTAQDMEPIESFGSVASAHPDESARWFETGLGAVRDGKVAVVVLCGGQGTRLGFDGPKGMYDIGLPSGKTLFQLQAERLRRVCALAAGCSGNASDGGSNGAAVATPRIPWYIMTSPLNDAATREFFASNDYFGVPKEDVFFFSQVLVFLFVFVFGAARIMRARVWYCLKRGSPSLSVRVWSAFVNHPRWRVVLLSLIRGWAARNPRAETSPARPYLGLPL